MECPPRGIIRLNAEYLLDWLIQNKDEAICHFYNDTREEMIEYIYQAMLDFYSIA